MAKINWEKLRREAGKTCQVVSLGSPSRSWPLWVVTARCSKEDGLLAVVKSRTADEAVNHALCTWGIKRERLGWGEYPWEHDGREGWFIKTEDGGLSYDDGGPRWSWEVKVGKLLPGGTAPDAVCW